MWSPVDEQRPPLAAIFSVGGLVVSKEERALFAQADPLGFILFTRNCAEPAQLRQLTAKLKETLGRDCPILVDQEGGRVQRLRPPYWTGQRAMKFFGDLARDQGLPRATLDLRRAVQTQGEELAACGVSVNCAPVLDVLDAATHSAIGDRAFSDDPDIVAALGAEVCRTFLSGGVTPVVKHMPGHGRAALDSHHDLPAVSAALADLERDFRPFRAIAQSPIGERVWGMAAHVVYTACDADNPASVSEKALSELIRGRIGFDGFLLSDDLSMDALAAYGDVAERAALSLRCGMDAALHCSGNLYEMELMAENLPRLGPASLRRLNRSAAGERVAA